MIIYGVMVRGYSSENYFDLILDVRNTSEWLDGNYPNSLNIPIKYLKKYKNNDKKIKILIYYKNFNGSKKAYKILTKNGFKNVLFFENKYNKLLSP